MKIMVIEDSGEELAKAKEIIEAMGHEVVTCNPSEEYPCEKFATKEFYTVLSAAVRRENNFSGIITDLNFEIRGTSSGITQSGLLVALHATSFGKPCVICTRLEEGDNHHGAKTSWMYDGYFLKNKLRMDDLKASVHAYPGMAEKFRVQEREFNSRCVGWVEKKDWKRACEELEKKFVS